MKMFGCRRIYDGPRYAVRERNLVFSRSDLVRDLILASLAPDIYYVVWDNARNRKVPCADYRTWKEARDQARDLNTRLAPRRRPRKAASA